MEGKADFPAIAKPPPLLIVISGPSGVGKDAILLHMKRRFPSYFYPITMTTRPRRENEIEGEHYFFVSEVVFMEMVRKRKLIEWSKVYGRLYGVPAGQVREALQRGQDIVVKVDVQGAKKIKEMFPGAILIFIAPPSEQVLLSRLNRRQTEGTEDLKLRLETARGEMNCLPVFNYVVVNNEGKVDETLRQIEAIIVAEKLRIHPTPPTL